MNAASPAPRIFGFLLIILQGCTGVPRTPATATDSAQSVPAKDAAAATLPADQASLTKIALGTDTKNRGVRAAAIQRLADQRVLTGLAGRIGEETFDLIEAAARLRLVMLDPIVTARIPDAKVATEYSATSRAYNVGPIGGESVTLTIQRDAQRLAQASFRSDFPVSETVYGGVPSFFPARVDIAPLLTEFFAQPEFIQADLIKLSRSPIVELQVGAIGDLTDQPTIARILAGPGQSRVRAAAADRSTDQAQLIKIALNDRDYEVRAHAAANVTDQAVLAKIVQTDKVADVRMAAVKNLADTTLLQHVADHDGDQRVQIEAMEKLGLSEQQALDTIRASLLAANDTTDPAKLAKLATDDERDYIRQGAVMKLTDQSLLARIAAQDKSPMVRYTAKDRLKALRAGAP